MPNFESAAELDKALQDGSFRDDKVETYQPVEKQETYSEPALTPQERQNMSVTTMFIEASHNFRAVAAEASGSGLGAIAQHAEARSGELYAKSQEPGEMPEETREAWDARLKTELDNLQQSLTAAKEAKESSARENRTEQGRAEVDQALSAVESEQTIAPVDNSVHQQAIAEQPGQLEAPDPALFVSGNTIREAFDALAANASSRLHKKQIQAIGKRYEHSYKELNHDRQKGKLSIEESITRRDELSKQAQEEWKIQQNFTEK